MVDESCDDGVRAGYMRGADVKEFADGERLGGVGALAVKALRVNAEGASEVVAVVLT